MAAGLGGGPAFSVADERAQFGEGAFASQHEFAFAQHSFQRVEHDGPGFGGGVPAEFVRPFFGSSVFDPSRVNPRVLEAGSQCDVICPETSASAPHSSR